MNSVNWFEEINATTPVTVNKTTEPKTQHVAPINRNNPKKDFKNKGPKTFNSSNNSDHKKYNSIIAVSKEGKVDIDDCTYNDRQIKHIQRLMKMSQEGKLLNLNIVANDNKVKSVPNKKLINPKACINCNQACGGKGSCLKGVETVYTCKFCNGMNSCKKDQCSGGLTTFNECNSCHKKNTCGPKVPCPEFKFPICRKCDTKSFCTAYNCKKFGKLNPLDK